MRTWPRARARIHLKDLEDLWQGLDQGKQRKLFNKCCPYYLNTSPSFKEKSLRLWVVSCSKWRRTKWRHFVSILECLVCLNNGSIHVKLDDQKYVLGYSTKGALVWFSSSCNKGPIGSLGINLGVTFGCHNFSYTQPFKFF